MRARALRRRAHPSRVWAATAVITVAIDIRIAAAARNAGNRAAER